MTFNQITEISVVKKIRIRIVTYNEKFGEIDLYSRDPELLKFYIDPIRPVGILVTYKKLSMFRYLIMVVKRLNCDWELK